MRVLIDYRPALRQRSGAGEYVHQLAAALLAAGGPPALDLTLFSSSWKDRLTLAPELARARGVDRRVPVRLLNLAWHRLEWPSIERLTGLAFDVAHAPHPLLVPARAAAQVVTIHDLYFLQHPERTRGEVRRDYPALVRDHARRADRIVVPSRFTAGEVERTLSVPPDRISVCAPGAPDWPPGPPRPAAEGYVLFVGTLEPRKNLGALLDAYEQLAARRRMPPLVVAGRPVEQARPWLERIARAPLAGIVRHTGYVDASRRRDLYAGARMLVLPSFEEGFGLPVLEAMTLGVPVVAASSGALPEVTGGAGLLVDPARPEELAAAIARVLDDEALAGALAARGRERAAAFRWDLTARGAYDAYRLAIEHRRCASA